MFTLPEVGALPTQTSPGKFSVQFGLYLPGITARDRFVAIVRIIHTQDRFDPSIAPVDVALTWNPGTPLDLWSAHAAIIPVKDSHFGLKGLYLYRYELWWTAPNGTRQCVSPWITDPFAREAEIGRMSAFTLDPAAQPFSWTDAGYRTPELDDLIVYELQVDEFNETFDGIVDRLTYLQSLGINCLELMPITSRKLDFDWGYGPLHFFAPALRFGGSAGLKRLVDAAHHLGIAVILDVVYEHVDTMFPYFRVYDDLAGVPGAPQLSNPMMNGFNIYGFGPKPDFTLPFTQNYFSTANQHWLDEYHVDGFRYDEVSDLYVPPMDAGYATLVHETYRHSLKLPRFGRPTGGYSRIIQCAEALDRARTVLTETVTNCAWQNGLLYQAEAVAAGAAPTDSYAHQLDPSFGGFPATTSAFDAAGNTVSMPVAPFQYLESHDHSQLIVFTGTGSPGSDPIPEGDRSRFYKLQPHAIALYTCQGIPMLWQGQEFADNYNLPDDGLSRVHLQRDTHWEYFYDASGFPLVQLYRRLAFLRRTVSALRSRSSFYFWQQSLHGTELLIYSRHAATSATAPESWALVLLNFADDKVNANVQFPVAGTWREMLDDTHRPSHLDVTPAHDGDTLPLTIPSNYGQVWVKL